MESHKSSECQNTAKTKDWHVLYGHTRRKNVKFDSIQRHQRKCDGKELVMSYVWVWKQIVVQVEI